MLDFTSALYLGLEHPSAALRPWAHLTEGVPAALACLVGTERGTLLPSTLHAFWDLFGILPADGVRIFVDAGTYPIGRWGVDRAAARGTTVRSFRHHDPEALASAISVGSGATLRPVAVADGWCPGCGGPAPIPEYLEVLRPHAGFLVLDDTQALGVLGTRPSAHPPFGVGGGGSLRWHGLVGGPTGIRQPGRPGEVVVIASLAKGFGVPLAVLAGDRSFLSWFESRSEVRIHASPVSTADTRAAERALALNRTSGEARRLHLARLIARFRAGLAPLRIPLSGGAFPVQSILAAPGFDPVAAHGSLRRSGIRTAVIEGRCRRGPSLAFLITARHSPDDVDSALFALSRSMPAARPPSIRGRALPARR